MSQTVIAPGPATRSCPDGVPRIGIIGAGPAGLTAALELVRHGRSVEMFEATDSIGGISRTVVRDGWRFDIGGHRFYTKVGEVEALWESLLSSQEFPVRRRMSRIHYRGKLFDYPLKPLNALRNLGVVEAIRCVVSYAWARVHPPADQTTFEGWVAARFGWRLYRMFFKTYTEKVWGVEANTIPADWAAQRIKNLSLLAAVRQSVLPERAPQVTSLIEQFRYPLLGPGMMWERARDEVIAAGSAVHMRAPVRRIEHHDGAVRAVITGVDADDERRHNLDQLISSMPLGELVEALSPAPPDPVLRAARALHHRDFLTVALVVAQQDAFPDNWIYVHDTAVRVGRIQNFGAWSPDLVEQGSACLGMEYFLNTTDALWSVPDDDLVALATRELDLLGLVRRGSVRAGYVVRMPKAYPVYDEHYAAHVSTIRSWLSENLPGVHPVGRNGMHRYNNADHSMVTGLWAARNVLGGGPALDPWSVNVEEDYGEEDHRGEGRGEEDHGEREAGDVAAGTGRAAPVLPVTP